MAKQRISIINRSTGRHRTEKIDGRDHLVTDMMVIEGDSVMNGLLYPQGVVANAAPQLDMLPAPDGHPKSGGRPVSAFNPIAINAHNFGGFSRGPRVEGKRTLAELVIDLQVANRTARGRQIVNRVRSGKRIGVSTGLVANVVEDSGSVGRDKFSGRVENIQYDHVAVLLDSPPAGRNTFTLNHDRKRRAMDNEVIYDLSSLALEDRLLFGQLTVNEILAAVKGKPSIEDARAVINEAGFQVNQVKQADIDEFLANADEFAAFKATRSAKRQETVDFIVGNSKMTAEQLADLTDDSLESLANSVAPKNKRVMNQSGGPELVLLDDNQLAAGGGK